jgi:hypothetical protein
VPGIIYIPCQSEVSGNSLQSNFPLLIQEMISISKVLEISTHSAFSIFPTLHNEFSPCLIIHSLLGFSLYIPKRLPWYFSYSLTPDSPLRLSAGHLPSLVPSTAPKKATERKCHLCSHTKSEKSATIQDISVRNAILGYA